MTSTNGIQSYNLNSEQYKGNKNEHFDLVQIESTKPSSVSSLITLILSSNFSF